MKTAARQVDAWQSAINQACEITQQALRANNGLRANQKTKVLYVCADERCLMQDSFYLPVVDMNPVSITFLLSLKSKQSLPWTWWNWCPQVQMPQSAVKSCSHTHCICNDWSRRTLNYNWIWPKMRQSENFHSMCFNTGLLVGRYFSKWRANKYSAVRISLQPPQHPGLHLQAAAATASNGAYIQASEGYDVKPKSLTVQRKMSIRFSSPVTSTGLAQNQTNWRLRSRSVFCFVTRVV